MELRRFIRTDITASAIAHLSVLALVFLFTEVHPFGVVTAELHLALASDPRVPAFAPEPIEQTDLANWRGALDDEVRDTVAALAEALGFKYRYDAPTAQFAHPAVVFVLTPDGRISRYLYGVEFLARDLRLAVVEASQGRVGTTLDRVLLKCFRYDPVSRRYRVVAVNFVRGGAFCVFLALATGLAILWRQELKRRKSSDPQGRLAP